MEPIRRCGRMIWGGALVALGIVFIPTPLVPGIPVILAGLGVLSSDLRCARVMLQKLNGRKRIASSTQNTPRQDHPRKMTKQLRRTPLKALPA